MPRYTVRTECIPSRYAAMVLVAWISDAMPDDPLSAEPLSWHHSVEAAVRVCDALNAAEQRELYEILKAITDCYGVGSTPEAFCGNVRDFMLQAREVLAKAKGAAAERALAVHTSWMED